jgi:hypothetical protein
MTYLIQAAGMRGAHVGVAGQINRQLHARRKLGCASPASTAW